MRISVPYVVDFPYYDEVAEIDIKYNHTKDDFAQLLEFVTERRRQRVNVQLTAPDTNLDDLQALLAVSPNVHFKLDFIDFERLDEFKIAGLPFYPDLIANSWDLLNSIVNSGASDVYIGGELGFHMNRVAEVCLQTGVRSRVFVNLAQQEDPFNTSMNAKAFFIRPEDLEVYAQRIETFEFFYTNKEQVKTLYEIYVHDKKWYGDLAEIIVNLETVVDSRSLMPDWAAFRFNCGKQCYRGSGCTLCDQVLELGDILGEKAILFTHTEEPEEVE